MDCNLLNELLDGYIMVIKVDWCEYVLIIIDVYWIWICKCLEIFGNWL